MLRSKSTRSGSFGFGRKSHTSVLSRTFSASKFCGGDPLISQIDSNAHKPVEQKPSKVANFSEKQTVRISKMQQQQTDQLDDKLKVTTDQLGLVKEERDRALDELREMKRVGGEAANMKKTSEDLPCSAKEPLSNSTKELKTKDKIIESLKLELNKAKEFEIRLAERDASFERLKEEMTKTKDSEVQTMGLLSESKRRIQELEGQIERGKQLEAKMNDQLASQTKELEQAMIKIDESNLDVASQHDKTKKLETLPTQSSRDLNGAHNHNHANADSTKEAVKSLRSELQLAKENLARAQELEKVASSKANKLQEEMNSLKGELKFATEAEDKSTKARDDLALALKEVATEANQAKEKLASTEEELRCIKEEAEKSKGTVRSTHERCQMLLDEVKKENEQYKNTVERLRLEAEESLLAWNDREIGFVNCIKVADEEKAHAQQENIRLSESLKAARGENFKLRDILKQALNEANAAKEAAAIAKAENTQLKDDIAEKDEALVFVTQENERLRIDEAAALESIKELKRLLSVASTRETKTIKKKEPGWIFNSADSVVVKPENMQKTNKAFSFDLSELKIPNEHQEVSEKVEEEDPVKAEALKGSIFDTVDSPMSEVHTPAHRRPPSCSFTDDGGEMEDLDHAECSHSYDSESEKCLQRKGRPFFIRRFGDLVRKSFHSRKEPSLEYEKKLAQEGTIH